MKYFKPLLFAIAGFAIAFMVSFTSEEPKKEYCYVTIGYVGIQTLEIVTKEGSTTKLKPKESSYHVFINGEINNLANEGWVLKSFAMTPTGREYILERTKP